MVGRRLITIAVSCCLVLAFALVQVDRLFGQDTAKKAEAQPPTAPQTTKETPKTDPGKPAEPAKPQDTPKADAAKPVEPPDPPIPAEVQAKIEAARKAVAEMIVAAQDAGLVETSIDPPPILDILITGRAKDARTLKGTKKPFGLSPEVFGAWFTSYGKTEGINYVDDVRVLQPSDGLKLWYDQRAQFLEKYMQEIRKAKGPAPKKDDAKPATPPPADASKAATPAPADATKAVAPPPTEAPKAAAPAATKAADPKKN
jgi:hypothetical protein